MLPKTNTFNLNLNLMQSILEKFSKNWWNGTWRQIWKPEFDPWSTHGRNREAIVIRCSLIDTCIPWYVCTHTPTYMHTRYKKIIKFGKQFFNCKNEKCLRKQTWFTWFKHCATYTYVKHKYPIKKYNFYVFVYLLKGKRLNLWKINKCYVEKNQYE